MRFRIAVTRLILSLPLFCARIGLAAAPDEAPADQWVTNQVFFPSTVSNQPVQTAGFESLHAEAGAGRLKLYWHPVQPDTNALVALVASADQLGHWQVRDWRSYPMSFSGLDWAAKVPMESIDVPLVYFVRVSTISGTNVSPMRICHPRALGLDAPARPFWTFLEGFEQGTESWRLVEDTLSNAPLKIDAEARSGHAALKVPLRAGQNSVTVATTRVRGWRIEENDATGLRLWLRAKRGGGRARFTLHANAFTPNQTLSVSSVEATLDERWQKVSLPFTSFSNLSVGAIDWFTIEFPGQAPQDFLVDDLELVSPWESGPE